MAEQVEPIRRRVALKVIKLGMDTKQVIARFEAERQAWYVRPVPGCVGSWPQSPSQAVLGRCGLGVLPGTQPLEVWKIVVGSRHLAALADAGSRVDTQWRGGAGPLRA
jgi:hypothetical protein